MYSEYVCELIVCVDCMIQAANGEVSPDRPADLPAVWSRLSPDESVTMGGAHADGCPNRDAGNETIDCDCDQLGFTWMPCEGCGDGHGGDRYRFTLWRHSADDARSGFRAARERVRALTDPVRRSERASWLDAMRSYRSSLADRKAELTLSAGRKVSPS